MNWIIQAFCKDGGFTDAEHSGPTRAMTEDEGHLITAAVVNDPFQSAEDIHEGLSLVVSPNTIRKLSELGLHCFIAAQKHSL